MKMKKIHWIVLLSIILVVFAYILGNDIGSVFPKNKE